MKNQEFYNSKLNNETSTIKKVGWENETKAVKRYELIADLLPNNIHSLVDYGCGLCEFKKYISTDIEYIGVDTHFEFIEYYMQKNGIELNTFVTDGSGVLPPNDIVVNIGAWTLKGDLTDDEYWSSITEQVENMILTTKVGLIINGFHNMVDYEDVKLYYHDLNKWISLCNSMGLKMRLLLFEKHEFILFILK